MIQRRYCWNKERGPWITCKCCEEVVREAWRELVGSSCEEVVARLCRVVSSLKGLRMMRVSVLYDAKDNVGRERDEVGSVESCEGLLDVDCEGARVSSLT